MITRASLFETEAVRGGGGKGGEKKRRTKALNAPPLKSVLASKRLLVGGERSEEGAEANEGLRGHQENMSRWARKRGRREGAENS